MNARDLVYYLKRQHPTGASTFSKCSTKSCNNHARGGYRCSCCLEKELAKLIGDENAANIHRAIKQIQQSYVEIDKILDKVEI